MKILSKIDVEKKLTEESLFKSKRNIDHGVQFILKDGTNVNWYKTGSVVVQGKSQAVKQRVEKLFALRDNSHQKSDSTNSSSSFSETPTRVFIVYGHDAQAREQLELLIRRLKLEPIVLQNVPGAGDTIIEKLEKLTSADFACVLLTPDDEGRKRSPSSRKEKLQFRARQNVVLELGMVLARLGRTRVAILVKGEDGELERPSDIDGLLYISFKDHVDEAKNPLASNLQKAGFSIQIDDLLS